MYTLQLCRRSEPVHTCTRPIRAVAMGGGAQYPYPKEVWSPAGGWWARPKNWKTNTVVVMGGVVALSYLVFRGTAHKEVRSTQPARWIPSMMYQQQFKDSK
ncbi:hypothetical protein PIIN_03879 [Serendipita indica DSM 11827]|uniref:Uncharacterized protein n=1 Tax=Serendipita indica (strain DSM 11827) TaxID=1109443 RepID=G4TF40_SERID|nr:hypothetical protein PIIN_03879 [Serendipita indica DSM 11827]